jgi:restriction system protein
MKGPKFLKYWIPLINVLKESGGAGPTSEIIDSVTEKMNISEDELEETLKSGAPKVRNAIQFARLYLVKSELMDSSTRGIWKLTEKGFETILDEDKVYKLFKKVQQTLSDNRKIQNSSDSSNEDDDTEIDNNEVIDESHQTIVLNILKSMTAKGFELICKRLLTEIGLENVQVIGGANDHGIDGTGIIRINDVVSFTVIFQCKRFKDVVSPNYIRDFRGTMQGRADKGIFITTGRFTTESKKEAKRDGVPTIELIDGEKLVDLFEKYELGLKPKTIYDILPDFFENFK